jgi:hypothetical protein
LEEAVGGSNPVAAACSWQLPHARNEGGPVFLRRN